MPKIWSGCVYIYIYIYLSVCVCFWYLTYLSRFFAKSRGTKLVLRASLRPFAIVRHSWQCSWCLHNCWFWCDQARFLRPTGARCLGSNFCNETAAGDSDVMAKNKLTSQAAAKLQVGGWPSFLTQHPSGIIKDLRDASRNVGYFLYIQYLGAIFARPK